MGPKEFELLLYLSEPDFIAFYLLIDKGFDDAFLLDQKMGIAFLGLLISGREIAAFEKRLVYIERVFGGVLTRGFKVMEEEAACRCMVSKNSLHKLSQNAKGDRMNPL